jgi:hypothetical protein
MAEIIDFIEYKQNKEFEQMFSKFEQRLLELGWADLSYDVFIFDEDFNMTKIGEIEVE